jgi:formate dehydrogenase maturation protein FdhE
MAKSTKIRAAEIKEHVTELLLTHRSRSKIIEYCRENFDIKRAQVDSYIKQVNQEFLEVLKPSIKEHLSTALKSLDRLQAKAESAGDLKLTHDIERTRHKLLKLETLQVELSGAVSVDIINKDELLKIIEQERYDGEPEASTI